MPWSIFRKVKRALDEVDIEGLLKLGCPPDEYDGEASDIEHRIAKLTDYGARRPAREEVERIVESVWQDQFGPFSSEDITLRRDAFARVAELISS